MIRRGTDEGVDIGVVQDVAEVLSRFRRFPRDLLDVRGPGGRSIGIDVGHVLDFDAGLSGKASSQRSPATHTHYANRHLLAD